MHMKIQCPYCKRTHEITMPSLSKGGKNRWIGISTEQRSAMANKAWATKRAKKALAGADLKNATGD